jgi:hypothetical protein
VPVGTRVGLAHSSTAQGQAFERLADLAGFVFVFADCRCGHAESSFHAELSCLLLELS